MSRQFETASVYLRIKVVRIKFALVIARMIQFNFADNFSISTTRVFTVTACLSRVSFQRIIGALKLHICVRDSLRFSSASRENCSRVFRQKPYVIELAQPPAPSVTITPALLCILYIVRMLFYLATFVLSWISRWVFSIVFTKWA